MAKTWPPPLTWGAHAVSGSWGPHHYNADEANAAHEAAMNELEAENRSLLDQLHVANRTIDALERDAGMAELREQLDCANQAIETLVRLGLVGTRAEIAEVAERFNKEGRDAAVKETRLRELLRAQEYGQTMAEDELRQKLSSYAHEIDHVKACCEELTDLVGNLECDVAYWKGLAESLLAKRNSQRDISGVSTSGNDGVPHDAEQQDRVEHVRKTENFSDTTGNKATTKSPNAQFNIPYDRGQNDTKSTELYSFCPDSEIDALRRERDEAILVKAYSLEARIRQTEAAQRLIDAGAKKLRKKGERK